MKQADPVSTEDLISRFLENVETEELPPDAPLWEQLERYEDIIDSEVGDTSLVRARHLERAYSLRQLYLKFEGSNPTGTQKDRIAFAQAMDALRRGYDTLTVATCGNYGVAVALAASLAGLRCAIFIPENYHTSRVKEMADLGAEILRVGKDYEEAVKASQDEAATREWYDGNPGGDNTLLQLQAYGEIAYEIYDDLRDAPRVVAVPVSNGTVLAGIYKGFVRLYRKGKTSRIPLMVAGSSLGKNPIVQSFAKGSEYCEDLDPALIKETEWNEPLINWHSIDGDLALEAIRRSGGWAEGVSDHRMRDFARLLREKESINVLPAATAGLVALIKRHEREPLTNDRFVAVLTARKG